MLPALRRSGGWRHHSYQEMAISIAVPDALIARAKAGELEALEQLYRAFETPVYNLARRILRRPEEAEDVVQETFLEIVRSIRRYRGEGQLWAWVRRIAASKALMRIRRERVRAEEEFDETLTGSTAPVGVPLQIDLERALDQLSETSRAVVWLHDVEGYTHEEIAEMTGKTVSFSKSQLARAHARLRRMLNDEGAVR
jgi:RNA polymerase sigma factor (sigma-70 family)